MQTNPITALVPSGDASKKSEQAQSGGDSFFGTLMDMINPLQHIPIVSNIYEQATGDTMSSGAEILGGGLFGGIPGAISSLLNVGVEATTGKGIAANMMDALPNGQKPGLYQAMAGTALSADKGEALTTIAYTGTSAPIPEPVFYDLSKVPNLAAYSNPSLGLSDTNKAEQLKADMNKTLTNLIT